MSLTSFNNDQARLQKRMNESVYPGNYYMNVPGWGGNNLSYFEDPQIRQQYFAGNMDTNIVSLEGELMGYKNVIQPKKSERNIPAEQEIVSANAKSTSTVPFNTNGFITDESRSTHPAWTYRNLEYHYFENPMLDPLYCLEKPFEHNIQTRILEKDYFVRKPRESPEL